MDVSVMVALGLGLLFLMFLIRVVGSMLKIFLIAFAASAAVLLALSLFSPQSVPQISRWLKTQSWYQPENFRSR